MSKKKSDIFTGVKKEYIDDCVIHSKKINAHLGIKLYEWLLKFSLVVVCLNIFIFCHDTIVKQLDILLVLGSFLLTANHIAFIICLSLGVIFLSIILKAIKETNKGIDKGIKEGHVEISTSLKPFVGIVKKKRKLKYVGFLVFGLVFSTLVWYEHTFVTFLILISFWLTVIYNYVFKETLTKVLENISEQTFEEYLRPTLKRSDEQKEIIN